MCAADPATMGLAQEAFARWFVDACCLCGCGGDLVSFASYGHKAMLRRCAVPWVPQSIPQPLPRRSVLSTADAPAALRQ